MAKSHAGSKADAIRAILNENPRTPTREIIARLAEQGVKVSANHIYFLKGKMKRRRGRPAKSGLATVAHKNGTPNPVQAVTKVKALAHELGGLKHLKQLVDLLSE
ncbi:MAG TPA: hypothetical protein VH120_14900 [Gemmataceae bacterium]|jgi:hypothetical protein|nr:hypothetical protein [Gemmataceae bacterium]